MDDDAVDRLASIAQQLACRVRDDDPVANQRWLHALTTPEEREALLYVLAAAIPDDRPWSRLTSWTWESPEHIERRRARWREAQKRQRTRRGEAA